MSAEPERAVPAPPRAETRPVESTWHGLVLNDEYAWLRADNWREVMRDPEVLDPAIRAHLEAENAYAEAALAHAEPLRERLFAELKGRIREDDSSVPAPDGPFAYAVRYREGDQHPRIVRRPRERLGEDAPEDEEVLLDGNALAEGRAYFRLGATRHGPDHSRLAWSADETGGEFFALRVRDLATREDLADRIESTTGRVVWLDAASFLYVEVDENHRPARVFRHALGTAREDDVLVYTERDPGFFVGIGETQSGRFALIEAHDHETSEVWLIDREAPGAGPRLVAARQTGLEYDVEHQGERLVIRTNAAGAEDFKIVEAAVASPGRAGWRDLVAHEPGRLILDIVAYRDHLVRLERVDGLPRIVVRRLSDGTEHAVSFEEEAYSLALSPGYEFDTGTTRLVYSSMTTPARVYDYDMHTRERTLRKEQEVPSGHDPADYVARRLHAVAADGESVPISLVHRKDTPLDGSAPCLLYGYGAYGITIPAAFNPNVFSLVDRGFVYAIAHVRGGKDKGYRWYAQGRREHKVNTFTDYIAAAEHLIAKRHTGWGRIVAQGGSAGGLLMGAVANIRPDLFLAVIAEVPFVDALNTMLDDTLPLTPPEWPEWGNPIEDADAFETIRAYAPYENVRAQKYPHILAIAGLTDPRVTYWEPAKWIARLRAAKTDGNLLVLKTHMDAGHAGAPGRFDRLKEVALNQAFALHVAGCVDTVAKTGAGR